MYPGTQNNEEMYKIWHSTSGLNLSTSGQNLRSDQIFFGST
jgi:hypothetical protein